ncbi:RNA-binding domain-containing protein [Cylindrobasidium torrendii FP15055 ss-10]|uniref:RNA-binding domain-containing protein n=1 Tax=Cylindrobasidium torrendii FP15055 ss-10 TaxID=1314674 RepID=A0A0D7BRQ3_9AGAR|nr:RNA-binding domain-containing protein [Cylindrobasidium torrendii FP15055 ss-10]
MSDAPAAQVPQNGAPPATQEKEEAPGFKVFAGNLAYSVTDEGLKAFFAPVQSDVLSAQVILRGTRSAGYGFVALVSEDAAKKAVSLLNKTELDGREVIIEIAKPSEQKDQEKKEKKAKKKATKRSSKAAPEGAEANGEAAPASAEDAPANAGTGDAEKPKKKKKTARKTKAKAETAEGAAATPATDAESTEKPVKQKKERKPKAPRPPKRPAGEDPAGEPSKTMLFVANLGFNIDDDGLKDLFTEAGIEVVSARIVRMRWGKPRRSKGYGFVDVGSEEIQKKALTALEGKEVGGRQIAVKIAVNPPPESEDEKADSKEGITEAAAPVEAAPVAAA